MGAAVLGTAGPSAVPLLLQPPQSFSLPDRQTHSLAVAALRCYTPWPEKKTNVSIDRNINPLYCFYTQ